MKIIRTITIVKVLAFMIVNTITIVGDQLFNTMIINKIKA